MDLAQAGSTSATPSEPITITITSSGELFLDGAQLTQKAMLNELQQFPPETLVLVRADRVIQLEQFVDVVDDVRGAGLTKISLAVAQE